MYGREASAASAACPHIKLDGYVQIFLGIGGRLKCFRHLDGLFGAYLFTPPAVSASFKKEVNFSPIGIQIRNDDGSRGAYVGTAAAAHASILIDLQLPAKSIRGFERLEGIG